MKINTTHITSQKPKAPDFKNKIQTFFETANAWGVFVMGSTFVLMLGAAYLVYILQNDFTQFNNIREDYSYGGSLRHLVRPQDYGNALPWNRAVTFVVNHDVPHNDGFRSWLLSPQDEHLAHVYMLGRDGGVPLIYSDNNESHYLEDKDRWLNLYKRPDITAMITFHNALHGESMVMLYESDILLVFRRGDRGIVAINKSDSDQRVDFNTWGLKNPGTYIDLIHNHRLTISENRLSLLIPSRSAQMWLLD